MAIDRLSEHVDGIIHEPTQVRENAVDLTVSEVFEITEPGRIDFGGGELEPAALTPHERQWRNEDDDYQWWQLNAGQYVIEYNESLRGDDPLQLQPRTALLDRGAFHPTVHTTSLARVPLSVGGAGLRLKENARISTLRQR